MEDRNEEWMQEPAEMSEESTEILRSESTEILPEEVQEEPAEPFRPLQEQDMLEFVRQYPGLDPRSIPTAVWDAVRGGETLVGAYGRHELQQLRADNARMRQQMEVLSGHARSRENSLGSVRSAGAAKAADGFLLGFEQA